jgi:pimeloyl-ACP methyl ester carboxylesterase
VTESPGHAAILRLRDGRALGYAVYGAPSGRPALLYFGVSRLEAALLAEPARRTGIRVIGIDRPGMGLSDFQTARRLLDWPADVVELTDHLGIGQFAIVGVSAGGPHALACARAIPERLTACGIVSGVAPIVVRPYQRVPILLTPMMWLMNRFFADPARAERSLTTLTRSWPEADRASLAAPGVRPIWAAALAEAFRPGARGMRYDSALVETQPWGFELGEIALSRLFLWHGELDRDVPVAMGRHLAANIRSCVARFLPDEGHLSVVVNHREEIVAALSGTDQKDKTSAARRDRGRGH